MTKCKLIGDCHGKIESLSSHLVQHGDNLKILQLGDMGLGFSDVHLPSIHKNFGFIRGNHDSPSMCRMHSNYAGDFGMWNGIFVMGGAYSIDWMHREPGFSWWPDEEMSHEELDECLKAYIAAKPRIVASHEAPQSVGNALIQDGGFRVYKYGSTESRTAKMMQRMFEHHQPEHWFFGHYHRNWQVSYAGTHFQCLDELSTTTVEVE